MNNHNTLYISDLDGTLLSSESRISAESIRLLNRAIEDGALISIATARTPATVSLLMKDIRIKIPMVVMTGASLWNINTGSYTDVQHFTPDQVRRVIDAYTSVSGGGAFLYTLKDSAEGKGLMEIYHIGSMNVTERGFMKERITSPFKIFHVPDSGLSELPDKIENAVLFFGMRDNTIADKIKANLDKLPDINPMAYHDWNGEDITEIEAFPSGATKAQAIMRLKERVGANRVIVFGDNVNDISMMKIADRSVAVGNALPEVKEIADEIIGSNDEDAVARYIMEDLRK